MRDPFLPRLCRPATVCLRLRQRPLLPRNKRDLLDPGAGYTEDLRQAVAAFGEKNSLPEAGFVCVREGWLECS